ncbi:MAG: hypothetical protein FJ088_05820, partial [Deltaproteobacteria bacterium]|nr:hypothetical protein [Deltaproteobacteria bacterium]
MRVYKPAVYFAFLLSIFSFCGGGGTVEPDIEFYEVDAPDADAVPDGDAIQPDGDADMEQQQQNEPVLN